MNDEMLSQLAQSGGWLPLAFLILMGIAILAYVILDGYDLGVGILLKRADDAQKDMMIASIGPFWDANETWLVLGVGILLTAFPLAHSIILQSLYLPVALLLLGLILRGVAFDFRVKAQAGQKHLWDAAFYGGSLLATLAQGIMIGLLILGFPQTLEAYAFAIFIGVCLVAGYVSLGAGWLLMKTEGELQRRAVRWARSSLWLTGIGIGAVSIVTPLVSRGIFEKWFSLPDFFLLLPIPLISALLFAVAEFHLGRMHKANKEGASLGPGVWVPFACTVGLFVLAFHGLAYSLFPYLIVDRMTIWQAAAARESLLIIFVGAAAVLPLIAAYTAFSYKTFWGKAEALSYE